MVNNHEFIPRIAEYKSLIDESIASAEQTKRGLNRQRSQVAEERQHAIEAAAAPYDLELERLKSEAEQIKAGAVDADALYTGRSLERVALRLYLNDVYRSKNPQFDLDQFQHESISVAENRFSRGVDLRPTLDGITKKVGDFEKLVHDLESSEEAIPLLIGDTKWINLGEALSNYEDRVHPADWKKFGSLYFGTIALSNIIHTKDRFESIEIHAKDLTRVTTGLTTWSEPHAEIYNNESIVAPLVTNEPRIGTYALNPEGAYHMLVPQPMFGNLRKGPSKFASWGDTALDMATTIIEDYDTPQETKRMIRELSHS